MNLYVNNYLSSIEVIDSTLQKQKNSLTNERVEKIMSNLDQLLHDLEHHVVMNKFTALTEPLKPWIVEVLQNVHQTLNLHYVGRLEKIEAIKNKILDLQTIVEVHPILNDKTIPTENVVGIAYFCDLHIPDHNGGIGWSLRQAIQQNVPFITTRSVLQASGMADNETMAMDQFHKMQKILYECMSKWDIYQKGEVFVFIPRITFSYLNPVERLEALDLRTDGNLKRSSVESIYAEAPVKSSIHDVIEAFASHATANIIFYAFGHGSSNAVAALNEADYKTFLNFLYSRRCKGLAISSCSAGGKSSLLNIEEKTSGGYADAKFFSRQKSHPFPTLVRSFGDFTTYTEQPAEKDLREFLAEFGDFTQGEQTFPKLRQIIRNIEGGQKKCFVNMIKFYPAHSAGIPGGFRPLNESYSAFSLTYGEVKKAEIEPVISSNYCDLCKPGTLVVRNVGMIEIHPLVTQLTLIFEKHIPVLFSMTPGHGHHFIKAITHNASYSVRTPLDFIRKTMEYHEKDFRYANKGFFIGEIKCGDKSLSGVALKITQHGSICVGMIDGCYYLIFGGNITIPITQFLYGLICDEIMNTTIGDNKAVIAMSGGQESEKDFVEAVSEENVFGLDFKCVLKMNDSLLFDHMKNIMNPSDREAAIIFLTEHKEGSRALKLLKSLDLDPNMKKYDSTPLIFAAAQANDLEMFMYLLNRGAEINVVNGGGRPLLNHAIIWLADAYEQVDINMCTEQEVLGREKILDLLLDHPALNLELLNFNGWTAVSSASLDCRILEKLIDKGAKIDHCHKKGKSLLAALIASREIEHADMFLAFKPDPNLGSPTALSCAFKSNDAKLIKELLKLGGTPFKSDDQGKIPFIDAVFWASVDVVEDLLKRKDCNPQIVSKNGMFPLLAALLIRNRKKIRMLKEEKFIFPESLSKEAENYFVTALDRYIEQDDESAIIDFLEIKNVPHGLVAERLVKQYKEPFLKKLSDKGVIDTLAFSSGVIACLSTYKYGSGEDEKSLRQISNSRVLSRSM